MQLGSSCLMSTSNLLTIRLYMKKSTKEVALAPQEQLFFDPKRIVGELASTFKIMRELSKLYQIGFVTVHGEETASGEKRAPPLQVRPLVMRHACLYSGDSGHT
jgi:hypothetical protein